MCWYTWLVWFWTTWIEFSTPCSVILCETTQKHFEHFFPTLLNLSLHSLSKTQSIPVSLRWFLSWKFSTETFSIRDYIAYSAVFEWRKSFNILWPHSSLDCLVGTEERIKNDLYKQRVDLWNRAYRKMWLGWKWKPMIDDG